MHLKSLDIVGFKSFADRTRLNFEKGMTAVVGPNGCGKSNISDCIRWVLGEQSAKALRGGSMADVIFNGADSAKPLNMAEVNLTLTECEGALGMDYNEVTITRRVFRSGEGQYFINKKPCRLKDIQRLFMGTGIGTNAYSVLEQGKIDMILSSRPDDRRAVFEEAAGVTKYKADRREALRKLDQTEANLLRLEDIVREVKRRIGSLQRQAGKARRYKTIQDELRGLDLFLARRRVKEIETHLHGLQEELQKMQARYDHLHQQVDAKDEEVTQARETLKSTEQSISEAMEATVRARTEWESTRQLISVNQDRIKELEDYTQRDHRDAEEARRRLGEHQQALETHKAAAAGAEEGRNLAASALEEARMKLEGVEQAMMAFRREVQERRQAADQTEKRMHQVQQQLAELDARDRESVLRRERLQGECDDLQQTISTREETAKTLQGAGEELAQALQAREASVETLQTDRGAKDAQSKETRDELTQLERTVSGLQAKLDLLSSATVREEGFPGGARALLGDTPLPGVDASRVLGSLAQALDVDQSYHAAVEACLRPWVDAVVVASPQELPHLLHVLRQQDSGAARLLAVGTADVPVADGPGEALIDHVRAPEAMQPVVRQLLAGVRVMDTFPEGLPPMWVTWVTKSGEILRGDGSAEFPDGDKKSHSPLALEHDRRQTEQALTEKRAEAERVDRRLKELVADHESTALQLRQARQERDELRQKSASHRGEQQSAERELHRARERFERVRKELDTLNARNAEGDERRKKLGDEVTALRQQLQELRGASESDSDQLRQREEARNEVVNEVTELRVKAAEARQHLENHQRQQRPMEERIREMQAVIEERARGVNTYQERIAKLKDELAAARERLQPLEQAMQSQQDVLTKAREDRQAKIDHVAALEKGLREQRQELEQLAAQRGKKDVEQAEESIRFQNIMERVERDYDLNREQLDEVSDPQWKDGVMPPLPELQKTVETLRKRLEAMGPVNLVAIEEYQEIEERYQFLMQQQEDLVTAKEQLLEMIKTINETTTKLFTETFHKVNAEFQTLFKSLFGGGSARLELVDAEDVLESGIDIVARPPGKKLQRVSLLSGGERTMTAVALLFALYTVKPSPFCVLDELDAALDDANIGRFVDMLKVFIKDSQFVVITHNRKTIEAADTLYGVTMQRKGISEIVSVKLTDFEAAMEPAAGGAKKRGGKKPEPVGAA